MKMTITVTGWRGGDCLWGLGKDISEKLMSYRQEGSRHDEVEGKAFRIKEQQAQRS